jgi:hypothetical protein
LDKKWTEIVFILDRSGSMSGLEEPPSGLHAFLQKRGRRGKRPYTTVLFNHEYQLLHDSLPIEEVLPITRLEYDVGGMTALLDAVGSTILRVRQQINGMSARHKPARGVFVITTDGYENSSREFGFAQVRDMIHTLVEKSGWEFIFLGANIDAEQFAGEIGIQADKAANYTASKTGTKRMYVSWQRKSEYPEYRVSAGGLETAAPEGRPED